MREGWVVGVRGGGSRKEGDREGRFRFQSPSLSSAIIGSASSPSF